MLCVWKFENKLFKTNDTALTSMTHYFQASKGASSYMDLDEAEVGVGESSEKDENPRDLLNPGSGMAHSIKDETDDNVTEQTHHIIVPSYRFVRPDFIQVRSFYHCTIRIQKQWGS